jgi:stage V sporulation protein D (sporulation-specific penicillin-binding protein)
VARKEFRDKVIMKKRMLYVLSVIFLIFIGLVIRLSFIMFVKGDTYKARATQQWTSDVKINAKRGRILDRNEKELAVSANVYRVDLDLNALRKSVEDKGLTMEAISPKIAEILQMDNAKVLSELTKTLPNGKLRGAAILKRRIEKDMADGIKKYSEETKLRGLVVSPDTKRYYPNGSFAAHILGHTNSDGAGLTGTELQYNKYLAGVPGIKIAETDQKSEDLPYKISEYTEPVDGRDVILTIDENIQYFAEKAASQALKDNDAKAVSVIVMDPKTGEILAMANKPDYDPNNPWPENLSDEETQKTWRNRAVSDAYEPGSIFKVVTATAAIEKGVLREGETFNCGGGLTIGGRTIHCWKTTGHGPLDFEGIIKNSCNVGFMTLAERMGKDALNEYIYKYGFGKKTGIDLPGEARGIVKPAEQISITDLATISFGQSNTVSAIQYMQAFNSIANGGTLITPHLMKEVIHYDKDNNRVIDATFSNLNKRAEIKPETMERMRGHLEATVSSGGASKTYIPGYHIAGKTGTAQKIDPVNGGYAASKYISSFAGMAPANDPKVTVFISIDEPNPSLYYAGQIAAPVGKVLFNDIFNYYALKPDATAEDIQKSLKKDVVIPEFRGNKNTEATKILKENGLNYRIEGDGEYVVDISPKPGYMVKEGSEIILYTGKESQIDRTVVVPDLRGSTPEAVRKLLQNLGITVEFVGEGVVVEQSVGAGQHVKKGTVVTCHLQVIAD